MNWSVDSKVRQTNHYHTILGILCHIGIESVCSLIPYQHFICLVCSYRTVHWYSNRMVPVQGLVLRWRALVYCMFSNMWALLWIKIMWLFEFFPRWGRNPCDVGHQESLIDTLSCGETKGSIIDESAWKWQLNGDFSITSVLHGLNSPWVRKTNSWCRLMQYSLW